MERIPMARVGRRHDVAVDSFVPMFMKLLRQLLSSSFRRRIVHFLPWTKQVCSRVSPSSSLARSSRICFGFIGVVIGLSLLSPAEAGFPILSLQRSHFLVIQDRVRPDDTVPPGVRSFFSLSRIHFSSTSMGLY